METKSSTAIRELSDGETKQVSGGNLLLGPALGPLGLSKNIFSFQFYVKTKASRSQERSFRAP